MEVKNKDTIEQLRAIGILRTPHFLTRIRIFLILVIFFLACEDFFNDSAMPPFKNVPGNTVNIVNKINMSMYPNEIKLDRFPIFEEMTSFVSSARF